MPGAEGTGWLPDGRVSRRHYLPQSSSPTHAWRRLQRPAGSRPAPPRLRSTRLHLGAIFPGHSPLHKDTRMSLAVLPFSLLTALLLASTSISVAQNPATLPSERPDTLRPSTEGFDYTRRVEMIPMRDGVKLHTVILVPKGAAHAPILLTRTPYDADALTTNSQSTHLGPSLYGYDNATDVIVEGGYIRVVQDVRGKYGSEGDYVMNRPLHGPQNPTPVDHSTDTYDTIDWLVKHVPESNGKVGILGISYDGFLSLMPLVNPHPALKVAVPMNPMVDGWKIRRAHV